MISKCTIDKKQDGIQEDGKSASHLIVDTCRWFQIMWLHFCIKYHNTNSTVKLPDKNAGKTVETSYNTCNAIYTLAAHL